jgi:TolB-like protein
MSGIIEGYSYDIFISYRQKDNKHDSWVTKFVDNLRGELEATFKEDVSVYFDENPHDRLQETHNVDKSLEGKLKCLIFIPILSQTYCDPNSYAWQYEFLAFIRMAEKDRFGKDIKLRSGNVASRILPIRIHDLEPEDVKLFEKETGSVLRALDFVFKTSTGVNRPLKVNEDHPNDNLNKTFYSDQINKVALAIKEIILGMKIESTGSVERENLSREPKAEVNKEGERKDLITKTLSNQKTKKRLIIFLLAFLSIIGAYAIFKIIDNSKQDKGSSNPEKSIAVLPFKNLSNDPEQEYFTDGMVEAILDHLYKVGELKVISGTSSMRYKDSKLPLKTIARELGVSSILEGSVQKIGNKVRITAQLIETKSDTHLWSETFDRDLSDVFSIQSEVAQSVARELKVKLISKEIALIQPVTLTGNQNAYDYYLKGIACESKTQISIAIEMFSKAIQEDPGFAAAYAKRARAHAFYYWDKREGWPAHDKLALNDLNKASELNPDLPELKIAQLYYYYQVKRDYEGALKTIKELKAEMPNFADLYALSGYILRRKGQFGEAISEQKSGIQLDPFMAQRISELADTYSLVDQYDDAIACARQGLSLFPDLKDFNYQIFYAYLYKSSDLKIALKESGLNENDFQYEMFYYTRQFNKCIEWIRKDTTIYLNQFYYNSKAQIFAFLYYLAGNKFLCRAYADSAIIDLKERIKEFPDDDRFYASLGWCHAFIGEYKEAIACGKKAVELKPVKLDAMQGANRENDLMGIFNWTENYDLALDIMEYLLSVPSDLHTGEIMINPLYDKLRDLPRFKEIINSAHKQLNVN